jgi:hypothetical protein
MGRSHCYSSSTTERADRTVHGLPTLYRFALAKASLPGLRAGLQ